MIGRNENKTKPAAAPRGCLLKSQIPLEKMNFNRRKKKDNFIHIGIWSHSYWRKTVQHFHASEDAVMKRKRRHINITSRTGVASSNGSVYWTSSSEPIIEVFFSE